MTNLKKFKVNFSRCTGRDVAPLIPENALKMSERD